MHGNRTVCVSTEIVIPVHCTAYYLKRSEYECIAYHMSVVRCTTNQQPVRTCTSGNGLEVLILGKLLRTETYSRCMQQTNSIQLHQYQRANSGNALLRASMRALPVDTCPNDEVYLYFFFFVKGKITTFAAYQLPAVISPQYNDGVIRVTQRLQLCEHFTNLSIAVRHSRVVPMRSSGQKTEK